MLLGQIFKTSIQPATLATTTATDQDVPLGIEGIGKGGILELAAQYLAIISIIIFGILIVLLIRYSLKRKIQWASDNDIRFTEIDNDRLRFQLMATGLIKKPLVVEKLRLTPNDVILQPGILPTKHPNPRIPCVAVKLELLTRDVKRRLRIAEQRTVHHLQLQQQLQKQQPRSKVFRKPKHKRS